MKSKDVYLDKKMKMADKKFDMVNERFVEVRIKNSFAAYNENKNALRAAQESSDGYDTDSSYAVMLKKMMSRNLAIWEHNMMSNDGS
jgi:hypothetical protein